MSEITKGIADKFVSIKDQIIDFAMTPFRKIRELFDNLLIGILESVEGIPLIGGKAKEMKENILANNTIYISYSHKKSIVSKYLNSVDKVFFRISNFIKTKNGGLKSKVRKFNYTRLS